MKNSGLVKSVNGVNGKSVGTKGVVVRIGAMVVQGLVLISAHNMLGQNVSSVSEAEILPLTSAGTPNPGYGWPSTGNAAGTVIAKPSAQVQYAAQSNPVDTLDYDTPIAIGSSTQAPGAQAPVQQAPQLQQRSYAPRTMAAKADFGPDAQIVTNLDSNGNPDELAEGTLLHTRLKQEINTQRRTSGTYFSAYLTEGITKNGRMIIPAFSTVRGRIIRANSGRVIHGGANLTLRADEIITPDGNRFMLHAMVVATDDRTRTKTKGEGNIVDDPSKAKTAETIALTTGVGAGAGVLLGGPTGMAIGAGVGAGIGTVHWLAHMRTIDLPKDSKLVFSLSEPMDLHGYERDFGLVGGLEGHPATVTNIPYSQPEVAKTPY